MRCHFPLRQAAGTIQSVFQLDSVNGKEHCSFFPSLLVLFEDCFKHMFEEQKLRVKCASGAFVLFESLFTSAKL